MWPCGKQRPSHVIVILLCLFIQVSRGTTDLPKASIDSRINVNPLNQYGQCFCGISNELNVPNDFVDFVDLVDPRLDLSHIVDPRMDLSRVVGGDRTDIGEYPWQVALLYGDSLSSQFCGGTLVSDRHVITAAHCTVQFTPADIKVAVGFTDLGAMDNMEQAQPNPRAAHANRVIVSVQKISNHPGYKGKDTLFEDDISVLLLSQSIDLYSHPNIKPACLPRKDPTRPRDGWYINQTAKVSGWGRTTYAGTSPKHLQDVELNVLGRENCGEVGEYFKGMRDSQFCAGFLSGGKDACQGDSGGPLVTQDSDNNGAQTLIGIVSVGAECAKPSWPGIYTSVKYFKTNGWLDAQLGGGATCPPPPSPSPPCSTVGPVNLQQVGKACKFPFKFGWTTYTACTPPGRDGPWCATEVDSQGNMATQGSWALCEEGCPIQGGGVVQKEESECPAKFPYSYDGGKNCCKYNTDCWGSSLNEKSTCCKYYKKCSKDICKSAQSTDENTGSLPSICSGSSAHFYPDPSDCGKFYQCSAGHAPFHMSCAAGTRWSVLKGICDHAANVVCTNKAPVECGRCIGQSWCGGKGVVTAKSCGECPFDKGGWYCEGAGQCRVKGQKPFTRCVPK